ncbi:SDR family oxidoreductase [Erythrobacter dokdonensis]|uniref:Short-chain dehydrogenase/reductase family protein n=1 Tax=Erythrobacter dokdonensis DSW-74 TaxID=1300349 RepID=A0A1A7BMF7_9SPHN|nr:SDR family oxidoreductase [Erythrobacter dokdonensis]OBV12657.1 short-chain dehydrogenase/reductase family protein [Erythrobacter dokdonensis DSW-74]
MSLDRRSLLAGAAATATLAATVRAGAADPVYTPALDFKGKSVLITGCSSGFGRLTAELLARQGARVFATMRNLPRREADELTALASAEKLDLRIIALDVTELAEVNAAVREAERINGGPIDVLVNNAGIGITSPVEVQDMEATRLMFETNVFGPHRMARAVLPGMRKKGAGQIIQISSQLGRVISPYSGHYSATKFALEAMSEQLAYELVPHNIDVSIIEPGGYPTKVWVNRNIYSAALKERAEAIHTAGYPQQVAAMGSEDGSGRRNDPMDVAKAIAGLVAQRPGTRPLRLPVSPGGKPQLPINAVTAQVQSEWLGGSPLLGPLVRGVHQR